GHIDIIEFLIKEKAPLEAVTHDLWTPLHGASSSGQTEAVELLLQHGANLYHQSLDEKTALHRACQGGHVETARALLQRAGADIHARSHIDEWQPIHFSALAGNAECVELCLKYGAQVNARTQSGQTPLHHA
ncbi:ankyrin repeat domain-containing protein, partial [Aspergillus fijiensis CBS 313.89]